MPQNDLYYFTYESHPDSPVESFRHDGLMFAMSDHAAYKKSQEHIQHIESPETEYDLGVHLTMKINNLAMDLYDISEDEIFEVVETTDQKLLEVARNEVTDADIREVGERQRKADLVEMGEDVEGMLTIDPDELEDIGDPY